MVMDELERGDLFLIQMERKGGMEGREGSIDRERKLHKLPTPLKTQTRMNTRRSDTVETPEKGGGEQTGRGRKELRREVHHSKPDFKIFMLLIFFYSYVSSP